MTKVTITLALLGALTIGFAEESSSIDAQINAIETAPAQERVRLMNEFKVKLAKMNEADRSEAINKLQTKTQTKTQTRTQEMQMQQNKEMIKVQNMNQQQAAKQYMKSGPSGTQVNNKMMGR